MCVNYNKRVIYASFTGNFTVKTEAEMSNFNCNKLHKKLK